MLTSRLIRVVSGAAVALLLASAAVAQEATATDGAQAAAPGSRKKAPRCRSLRLKALAAGQLRPWPTS